MESLGASQTLIGFHGSLYGVLQLISSPIVGKLSDQFGRRRLLLTVLLLCSFSYFLFGLTDKLMIYFIFRIPSGLLKHSLSLGRACVADVSNEEERTGRMGLYNAISSIGFVIGPAIGGNLMAIGGFKLAVSMTSVVFLINFFVSWWLVHPNQHQSKDHQQVNREEFNFQLSQLFMKSSTWPRVSNLMVQRFLMSVSHMMLRSNFTLFLEHKFNAGPQMIGYVTSFSGIVNFATSIITGQVTRLYDDQVKLVFHSALLILASQIAINFASHFSVVILLLIPLSFASSIMRVVSVHLCLQRVSPREKGEVMGMGQSSIALARIVGPQTAGLAMEHSTQLSGTIGIGFAAVATGLTFRQTSKGNVKQLKAE